MSDSGDILLQVLDEAPDDGGTPHPGEEEASALAVAEYGRGEAREADVGGQPSATMWRILVTPEARRDLGQREREIRTLEEAIRAKDPNLMDRVMARARGRLDVLRYELDGLRRLIEMPEGFRPQQLSHFPRYDVILLRRCPAHPDQWLVGAGRSRIMVDRDARAIVLLKVLPGTADRPNKLRKLLDLFRFLPMNIRLIRTVRRARRSDRAR
jgi:hypothetical protein